MTPISAVIITFNEENNIGRCLESLVGIVDDVVVVDSFSTDRTREICLEKGARFVEHAFEGHIQQKNWAISQAKYPHVLSLDADEALDETLKKAILEAKTNFEVDGYSMNRLTNYCGKWIRHSSWYPDVKLRLWDSRKGRWTGMNPHDEYKMDAGCTKKHLKGDILHYSYYSIEGHMQQVNSFTTILAKAMHESGKKAHLHKIILNPIASFIKDYILRLGFLDGFYGFVIATISSHATFLKYVKLRRIQENEKNNKS
jgi:glycosyltransferase involved in cell wall biosynthesis